MNVEIISATPGPIDTMWIAARTCYSSEGPLQMLHSNKLKVYDSNWKLVKAVLNSGHESIAEHINFTFGIEGISRACSHQLVRHRHCTFSQQSQRYVKVPVNGQEVSDLIQSYEKAENKKIDDYIHDKLLELAKQHFVIPNDHFLMYANILEWYLSNIEDDELKLEDARMILPNATKTNIVMTCNLRELMHMCNLRLCTRAQDEIRNLFKLIKEQVTLTYDKNIGDLLVSQCDKLGYCPEYKCCGRKKTLQDVLRCQEE